MKLTQVLRGGGGALTEVQPDYQSFGHLEDKVRGIVIYKLSPYEVKAFGPYNLQDLIFRRLGKGFISWVPYSIATYIIYQTVEKAYEHKCRKNPNDYPQSKEEYEGMVDNRAIEIKRDAHQKWQSQATDLKPKPKAK